jgi:hypothetical protein
LSRPASVAAVRLDLAAEWRYAGNGRSTRGSNPVATRSPTRPRGVSMQRDDDGRVASVRARWLRPAPALLAALVLAGCNTGGPTALAGKRIGTLAFDSIDGPPSAVFRDLVRKLDQEAQVRQLAVVSRDAPAAYRARGYLAAHVHRGGRTTISWVWDVYDAEERRALRIAGEEPAGSGARDPWTAADDQVLARIARASMEELAPLIAPSPPSRLSPQPDTQVGAEIAAAPASGEPFAYRPPAD